MGETMYVKARYAISHFLHILASVIEKYGKDNCVVIRELPSPVIIDGKYLSPLSIKRYVSYIIAFYRHHGKELPFERRYIRKKNNTYLAICGDPVEIRVAADEVLTNDWAGEPWRKWRSKGSETERLKERVSVLSKELRKCRAVAKLLEKVLTMSTRSMKRCVKEVVENGGSGRPECLIVVKLIDMATDTIGDESASSLLIEFWEKNDEQYIAMIERVDEEIRKVLQHVSTKE